MAVAMDAIAIGLIGLVSILDDRLLLFAILVTTRFGWIVS